MLDIVTFGHSSNLTAVNLNSIDDNIESGVADDIGMLLGTIWREWGVVTDGNPTGTSLFYFFNRVIVENAALMDGGRDDSWVDYTSPARHVSVTPDFPYNGASWDIPWTWTSGDRIYFGYPEIFDGLYFVLGTTAGATTANTWQYWNATTEAWTEINTPGGPTDNTNEFQVSAKAVFWDSNPTGGDDTANWGKVTLANANGNEHADDEYLYWVRTQISDHTRTFGISSVVKTNSAGARVSRGSELEVTATDPITMMVQIARGVAYIDGRLVILPYTTVTTLVAPTANKWYAAVQIDKDGDIVVDYGPIAGAPIPKNARVNALKLADILIDTTDTTISSTDITDMRNMII